MRVSVICPTTQCCWAHPNGPRIAKARTLRASGILPTKAQRRALRAFKLTRITRKTRSSYFKLDLGVALQSAVPVPELEMVMHCAFGSAYHRQPVHSTQKIASSPRARYRQRPPCRPGGIIAATIAHRHQLDRSGNEDHGGPLLAGVQASTSIAPTHPIHRSQQTTDVIQSDEYIIAYDKIKRALATHGASLADAVKQVVYVTDVRYQSDVAKCRREAYGDGPIPANTFAPMPGDVRVAVRRGRTNPTDSDGAACYLPDQ